MTTQLTLASGYNPKKQMIFGKPQIGTIPDSKFTYKRIPIQTLNADGTSGDLIIPTQRCFSFGVSENKNLETGKVDGYVFPICLFDKDGKTTEQDEWVNVFNQIVENAKDHLMDNKEELGLHELERAELKKLNPIYYKKVNGKIVDGATPTLYAKLIKSKKLDKIMTMFYDTDGNSMDAMDLLGKYCTATSAIKIESLFVGSRITLQVKLYEAEVKLLQTGMPRLLNADTPRRVLVHKVATNVASAAPVSPKEDEDDDAGSIPSNEESDNESSESIEVEPEPVKKVPAPAAVKKTVVKKVVKKA